MFPSNNIWNARVDSLPVHPDSAPYVQTIGASYGAHPDFGTNPAYGIPFTTVSGTQAKVAVSFTYAGESDPGPYPIPPNAPIEGGASSSGDRHVLVVDTGKCVLYELYAAYPNANGSWRAGSGAIFPLPSNQLRPAGWTSADAAGLPILPGLVRYDEVAAGAINHALRFTVPATEDTYVWPARHEASNISGTAYPAMGQRFRLRSNFDISSFGPHVQVILTALKKYGMIVADNGSSWYISGVSDPRWDDNELHQLSRVLGSNFEAVDESALMADANSGQVKQSVTGFTPNAWLTVVSKNSGKCMDIQGGPTATQKNAPLDQSACTGADNQKFQFTAATGGYKITVKSSSLQLDVSGGPSATGDGRPIIQWPYWGGSNEIWNVTPGAGGTYTISPLSSGKCMAVSGSSTSDGALIIQQTCDGRSAQAWQFTN